MSAAAMSATDRGELRSVVNDFMQKYSGEDDVRRLIDSDDGYDPSVWKRMAAEVGVQGIAIGEEFGGSGLSWAEAGMVLEEAGRALLCAPLLAVIVTAAALQECVAAGSDAAPIHTYLSALADGSLIATFAVGRRLGTRGVATPGTARVADGVTFLNGEYDAVVDGGTADLIVIGAVTDGTYGLYAVQASAPGVHRERLGALDLTRRLAHLRLSDAEAVPLLAGEAAQQVAARTLDLAGLALASEQVGAMEFLLDTTLSYVRCRQQFGRAIGSFQSVKHTCADMFVDVEAARAIVGFAQASVADDGFPALSALVQAQVTEAGVRTANAAIQMHGAIAYTWDHVAHLYLRRAQSSAHVFGAPAQHRERLVSLIGL